MSSPRALSKKPQIHGVIGMIEPLPDAPSGPSCHSRPGSRAHGWGGRAPRAALPALALLALLSGCGDTDRDNFGVDGGDTQAPGATGADDGAADNGGASGGGASAGSGAGATAGSNGGASAGSGGNGAGASAGANTGSEQDAGAGVPSDAHPHGDCVDRINELRATLSLTPLQRWTDAETCSDTQSANDAAGGGAHGNFGACQENAQNTCPGWPGVEAVVGGCLDAMWAEGPPPSEPCDGACFQAHGHYLNMTNPGFTKVACGFHDDGAGSVWSNQNFK